MLGSVLLALQLFILAEFSLFLIDRKKAYESAFERLKEIDV